MENKTRFCTNCGSALAADARFCPGCGSACAVAEPAAPVAEPVAAPVVEPVAAPVVEPVAAAPAPEAPSVNIAMPIVAMACGIMGFILTLAALSARGSLWENAIFYLLIAPSLALAIIFGLPNLKASIAARRVNTIIFSAVALGTAAFAATISLFDLLALIA